MLIVYKQVIGITADGLCMKDIPQIKIEKAGISPEELFAIAKTNTAEVLPAIVKDFCGMTVITNSFGIGGAAVVLYSDILSKIAERFESDLCVIPSSIHEMILLPASHFKEMQLQKIIREINASVLDPKDILSDHPYYYDRDRDILRIA